MTEYLLFMQRLLLVLLGLVCANYVSAYNFKAENQDGVVIYYDCIESIAIVTSGDEQYEGTVRIPATVKSIADYAFSNCGKLKKVVSEIKNTFEIDESVFSSLPEDAVLYVPKGTKEAYESIGGWNIKNSIR